MNKKLYARIFLILFIIAFVYPFNIAISGEKGPFSLFAIVGLLKDNVKDNEIKDIITEFGVSFEVTSDNILTLKSAGARDLIINAILSVKDTKTSFLYVSSKPASQLKIDGAKKGATPRLFDDLSPGEVSIWVGGLEEYNDREKTVEIRQGEFKTEHFPLEPKEEPTVSITLDTEPAGADLEIDGDPFGKTPRRVSLTEGWYDIIVRLDGYETINERIEIKRGGKDAYFYKLKKLVAFDSDPSGADLEIDGDPFGKTPQRRVPLTEGWHDIIVRLDGYKPIKEKIEIKRGGKDAYFYKFPIPQPPILPPPRLRSDRKELSISNIINDIDHFIKGKHRFVRSGLDCYCGHSNIRNSYEEKTIKKDKVVIDNATGLMWHQSGSGIAKNWEEAKVWLEVLNREGYAGENDWRLPTMDEAISLLESEMANERYINPVFDKKIKSMWTCDTVVDAKGVWYIHFSKVPQLIKPDKEGYVNWAPIDRKESFFVRPVRSMER